MSRDGDPRRAASLTNVPLRERPSSVTRPVVGEPHQLGDRHACAVRDAGQRGRAIARATSAALRSRVARGELAPGIAAIGRSRARQPRAGATRRTRNGHLP